MIPNYIVPSIARTGKSYTVIGEVPKYLDDERIVYVSSTHSEARASYEKFLEHGMNAAYLVGQRRARDEYDIPIEGPIDPSFVATTPEEAKKRRNINAYQSYVRGCREAQIVVTVPELLPKIGDRDWMIMTEEAAFSRMLSGSVGLIDVERCMGYDRNIKSDITHKRDNVQAIIDHIDDLQQTDKTHDHVYTACQAILDICNIVEDWKPSGWSDVKESWYDVKKDIQDRLDDIAYETKPDFASVQKRLSNHAASAEKTILNVLFHDGLLSYGDSETRDEEKENNNRRQLHIVGDTERAFANIPDDITLWTAGNSVPAMKEFHKLTHGMDFEIKPFYGGYTPVQDSVVVIKYTGGRNKNMQSHAVQSIIEEVQMVEPGVSSLIVSGSSRYCAKHAERIRMCTTPGRNDDLESIEQYAEAGMSVAIPENSRFSEGVDTPFFHMGAIYNGKFAAPREKYIKEHRNNGALLTAERIRAAQNSILRPSDIPDGNGGTTGTGTTPVIVPSRHVPDKTFEYLEEYGITVIEEDDTTVIRQFIVDVIDMDAEVRDGQLIHPDEAPTEARKFWELLKEQSEAAAD